MSSLANRIHSATTNSSHAMWPLRFTVRSACCLALLVLSYGIFWAIATIHQPPIGSDNDEYFLAAQQLAGLHAPVIAGVEYTKYPLGYPAMLALLHFWLGMPERWLVAVNFLAIACLCITTLLFLDHFQSWASATVVLLAIILSPAIWTAAQSLMPDVLAVALSTLGLGLAYRSQKSGDILWISIATGLAVLLKTLAFPAALVATALLAARRETRKRAWIVAAVTLVIVAGGLALSAGRPTHTTGYLTSLTLRNPWDQSLGRIPIAALPIDRLQHRTWISLVMFAQSVAGSVRPGIVVIVLCITPLLWHGTSRLRCCALLLFGFQGALVVLWPYDEPRFWLPCLPFLALGAGLAFTAANRSKPLLLIATLCLGGVVSYSSVRYINGLSARREVSWREARLELPLITHWLSQNAGPGDTIASLDYRELYRATHRSVIPLPYTSDTRTLARLMSGAKYLLATDLFKSLRGTYADKAALEQHLQPLYHTQHVTLYGLDSPQARPIPVSTGNATGSP